MTVQKTRKISIFKLILALLAIIIIVALLVLAYLFLTPKLINIGSSNMAPTLHRGSVVTFLPYAAFSYQPERWDMVLYKARSGEASVGRIVGMPQETIQLIDGELYINETIQPLPSELTQAGIRYLARMSSVQRKREKSSLIKRALTNTLSSVITLPLRSIAVTLGLSRGNL